MPETIPLSPATVIARALFFLTFREADAARESGLTPWK